MIVKPAVERNRKTKSEVPETMDGHNSQPRPVYKGPVSLPTREEYIAVGRMLGGDPESFGAAYDRLKASGDL